MAGLLIREMMARDIVRRCMIVAPGNLVAQWQDELRQKFRLHFDICDLRQDPGTVESRDLVITRMDQAKRPTYRPDLEATRWDLIVCDEAHKMSASYAGGDISYSQRYRLGELLGGITTHFLLMTATPHNGNQEDFQLFMRLLDQDRFRLLFRLGLEGTDITDVLLRRVKEDLVTMDSKPLFPERKAYTADYALSRQERDLYEAVTTYCREEFNRAARLEGGRRNTVGFALTVLQRRLASSPKAIYQSLKSRRQRLEHKSNDWNALMTYVEDALDVGSEDDPYDFTAEEREQLEFNTVILATAAANTLELALEIDKLRELELQADQVAAATPTANGTSCVRSGNTIYQKW